MSLDKAIQYKKEHRKAYRGAKAADYNCRNHGNCKFCQHNRLHSNQRRIVAVEQRCRDDITFSRYLVKIPVSEFLLGFDKKFPFRNIFRNRKNIWALLRTPFGV